jgi:serine/threonine protein kinase
VTAQIGVGGMGEVYQATDTNLKRQVALKVLPDAVAADAERLARFQREAEVLAALNHPNIAQIHGIERAEGTIAIVMELVEGPTLADRIADGPIPVDEVLPIARQITEALQAAHEQGIIHRDLKPANVKVRPDGTVKVLDFGLAKALEPPSAMSPGVSQLPTITTPAMTQAGMILGTAAYMSPEQARGRATDRRSDIWAFGAVLYEMLTGRRAFHGEDVTDTVAAVVRSEPDWAALGADVPARVQRVLRLCLRRTPSSASATSRRFGWRSTARSRRRRRRQRLHRRQHGRPRAPRCCRWPPPSEAHSSWPASWDGPSGRSRSRAA